MVYGLASTSGTDNGYLGLNRPTGDVGAHDPVKNSQQNQILLRFLAFEALLFLAIFQKYLHGAHFCTSWFFGYSLLNWIDLERIQECGNLAK